ncbi:MAG TPA: phosphohydrolase, partial [Aquaticitalea sp.]|nr:phosphohydrolase [Aquaticitalea sp.]
MDKLVDKWYRNQTHIYKVLLFVATTFLIVYIFPKSGKFKYNFDKGRPWQSENLYAPFDFAVKKSDEELKKEQEEITKNSDIYFTVDPKIVETVLKDFDARFTLAFDNKSSDYQQLHTVGKSILTAIYGVGLVEDNHNYSPDRKIVLIEEQKQKGTTTFDQLVKTDDIRRQLERAIDANGIVEHKARMLSLFFDVIRPNAMLNKSITDNALKEELNRISPNRGSIENGTLIISKGELVEGEKYDILKSLESEYESQVWSSKNYVWVTIAYTLLVALTLLMLLLFLGKYRAEVFSDNTKVTFIFFNIFLMVLLTTLVIKYNSTYVYIVPLCVLPLVLKAFFDARLGLFSHVLTVLLLGLVVPNSYEYMFLQIIAGIVTILTVSELYKRANLFISVGQITLVYIVAYFAFFV